MGNLDIYNKVRVVPKTAQKPIEGGRLKGKTDINPIWRIKTLTEQFGACGFGWRYEVIRFWLETGANNEIAAFAHINLYIKQADKWSEAIQGIGGSMFVGKEKNGLYTSDECYKMALTDAISVACKALGIGADVYWEADKTKYGSRETPEAPKQEQSKPNTEPKQETPKDYRMQLGELIRLSKGKITPGIVLETMEKKFGKRKANELNETQFLALLEELTNEAQS